MTGWEVSFTVPQPNSTMFKVVVLEDGPKEILFPAPLWSSGIESQGKLFMDCQLEWNVPEETPKACVSSPSPLPSVPRTYPSFLEHHSAEGAVICRWGDPKDGGWR